MLFEENEERPKKPGKPGEERPRRPERPGEDDGFIENLEDTENPSFEEI